MKLPLVIFLLLILFTSAFSQPSIIALKPGGSELLRYDYLSNTNTTLCTLPNVTITNQWSAIDAYNGRYFFMTASGSYRISSVDLTTGVLTLGPAIPSGGDIQYDGYQNRLVFQSNNLMLSYSLATETLDTLFSVQPSFYFYAPRVTVYNPLHADYSYALDTTYYTYNLSGSFLGTSTPLFCETTYDINLHKYYGLLCSSDTIFEFDPIAGTSTPIVKVPALHSCLGKEQASIDPVNHVYVFPYLDSLQQNKIISVDLVNHTILSNATFASGNCQEFYGYFDPVIHLNDSIIYSVFGLSYQWYLNGFAIPGATNQTITPSAQGYYKVYTTFMNGHSGFSNEEYFGTLNVSEKTPPENPLILFPTIATNELQIKNPDKAVSDATVFDATGRCLTFPIKYSGSDTSINTSKLQSGIYLLRIGNRSGVFIKE